MSDNKQDRKKAYARAYSKAYREANPEKVRASMKRWREANKDKEREYRKAYYEANKEKIKDHAKAYRKTNPEKIISQRKSHWQKYKDKNLARLKIYRESHREIRCALQSKRKAAKKEAMLPSTDLKVIKKLYEKRAKMSEKYNELYHVDHIIPLSVGGAHHQDNMRVITAKQNMEKKNKYIPELGGVWADNDLARETKKKLGIK